MSCGCGDIARCYSCCRRWFENRLHALTPMQLGELRTRLLEMAAAEKRQ